MNEILQRITEKKKQLDALRPFPVELDKNLYEWFKVALTYSSNAIEGNTLTLAETAQVVEKNITVSGKSIVEHLEAINHAKAVDFIQYLAKTKKHGSSQDHVASLAAQMHLNLASIHPFVDGNGRTARLLMNLLLLQEGYPLVIIDAKDRTKYINSIQKALQGDSTDYYQFIYQAIEHSLDEYITAAHESKLTS